MAQLEEANGVAGRDQMGHAPLGEKSIRKGQRGWAGVGATQFRKLLQGSAIVLKYDRSDRDPPRI